MELQHDHFEVTVQGDTKDERDTSARTRAAKYYGSDRFHIIYVSAAREAMPADVRMGSKPTYEADYTFEEGREHPANV